MSETKEKKISAKPFLKWAGGKSQLLTAFEKFLPQELKTGKIKNYYEPFLGSGALFLHIARHYKIKSAWLYDINPALILTWKTIQEKPETLITVLLDIEKKYHRLTKEKQQAFFYSQREAYNKERMGFTYTSISDMQIKRAAQLIFLNRTCFNGLYRVNSKGEFNTPAGRYNNPTICDTQNIVSVSELLGNATIQHAGYATVLKELRKNSLVYFDPPYRPLSKTASFNTYAKEYFGDDEQKKLSAVFLQIHQKGERVMLSNSDPKNSNPDDNFFDTLYSQFTISRIPAKRMINANAAKRGSINELIITNYPL